MKASIFAVLGLFLALNAFASGAPASPVSVKINSFTHIGDQNTPLGEVCGSVTVDTTVMPAQGNLIPVTVTSDPGSNNPGMYTVLADRVGNFCVLITTYTGTASAEAWTPGARFDTPVAMIDHAAKRAN